MDFLERGFLLLLCKGGALEPVNLTFGEFRSIPVCLLVSLVQDEQDEEEDLEEGLRRFLLWCLPCLSRSRDLLRLILWRLSRFSLDLLRLWCFFFLL